MEPTRIVFGRRLKELAKSYDFIVCNADTKACDLQDFGDLYPRRTISYGIAEQNMLAGAAGVASYGRKAVVSTYANFIAMRALEQVRTYVCQPNYDVLMLASHGGLLTGIEGVSHTALEDISILRALPNISILEPSDSVCAHAMVEEVLKHHGPTYVRMHYLPVPDVNDPSTYSFTFGKARVFADYGSDVLLCVTGTLLGRLAKAAEVLRNEGIYATVVEFPTIKPLDEEALIELAMAAGAVVTVEDHSVLGGFGSSVAEALSAKCPMPVVRLGARDRFSESSDPDTLYRINGLEVEDMVQAAKTSIALKAGH